MNLVVNNIICDLSLLWNSAENKKVSKKLTKDLVNSIGLHSLKILAEKNKPPIDMDYPVLIYKNSVIDGYEVLLKKFNMNKKSIKVIKINDKDIAFSKMD